MKKRIGFALLFVLGTIIIYYWSLLRYGAEQGFGQLRIVWRARNIEAVITDSAVQDSVKEKLRVILKVRQFAIDSLGLDDNGNYSTYFDQKGKEILWVVTAAERYRLKEKRWNFPFIGSLPYKGFFDPEKAMKEKSNLEDEGWDVRINNPGGWSTLGWLTDPVLSGMLERSMGDLASLIIHEMVHSTIFVKDGSDFNENLASFIGDQGAVRFLNTAFGEGSQELQIFLNEDADFRKYNDHVLRACVVLDSLYASIDGRSFLLKDSLKRQTIRKIVTSMDTLSLSYSAKPSVRFSKRLPNNAYFLSFRRYQAKQDNFIDEYYGKFGGDLKAFVTHYKSHYPYL